LKVESWNKHNQPNTCESVTSRDNQL